MRRSRTPARHSSARPLDPRENTLRPHLHVLSSNSTVQCTLPALVHSHTPLTRLLTYSLAYTEAYFSVKRVRCGGRTLNSVRSVSCARGRACGASRPPRVLSCAVADGGREESRGGRGLSWRARRQSHRRWLPPLSAPSRRLVCDSCAPAPPPTRPRRRAQAPRERLSSRHWRSSLHVRSLLVE